MDLISDIRRHDEREYRLSDKRTLANYKIESEFYFKRKDYLNPLRVHEEILRYYQSNYRTDNFMDMIQQFHQKGRALQRLGRWREARGIYDEAFALTMRYHGPHGFYVHKLANIKMWSEKGYEGYGESFEGQRSSCGKRLTIARIFNKMNAAKNPTTLPPPSHQVPTPNNPITPHQRPTNTHIIVLCRTKHRPVKNAKPTKYTNNKIIRTINYQTLTAVTTYIHTRCELVLRSRSTHVDFGPVREG